MRQLTHVCVWFISFFVFGGLNGTDDLHHVYYPNIVTHELNYRSLSAGVLRSSVALIVVTDDIHHVSE